MTRSPNPAPQARKSASMVGGVLLLIAAWNAWQGRPAVWMPTGAAGGVLVLTGLLWEAGSLAFHNGWMRFAAVLGHVNSRILLSLMFYLVIAPYGLLMRLFGRDPLRRRGPAEPSYWIPRKRPRQSREQFERLF